MLLLLLCTPLLLLLLWCSGLAWFRHWYQQQTTGDRYFRLSAAEKQYFQKQLRQYGRWLLPGLTLIARQKKSIEPPSFTYQQLNFPTASCNQQTLQHALHYQPQACDIVIATAMKSGTTWLQQIVFELLHQGNGDLSDQGYRHLYAASPWLETGNLASVALNSAPRLGSSQKRLIKTHLPASLCPWSASARYLYLVRDPVDCWLSCRDFLQMLSGPFCPDDDNLLDWFCSERMWWGDWPSHVQGWWQRSQQQSNVLWIHYDALLADPVTGIRRIADFLDIPVSNAMLARVQQKSSRAYMTAHQDSFSMTPPTLFSVHSDHVFIEKQAKVSAPSVRLFIEHYCRQSLQQYGLGFDTLIQTNHSA